MMRRFRTGLATRIPTPTAPQVNPFRTLPLRTKSVTRTGRSGLVRSGLVVRACVRVCV
jgi:hypothetical protein